MRRFKKLPTFLNSNLNIRIPAIYLVCLSLTIVFFYLYSFFTGNGDIIVYRHDNLDSNIAVYKLLADTGTFFSSNDTIIPNIMNGIPRVAFGSEFNVVALLYYLFEPMYAYIINEMFIRLIAFFGMFILLNKHFFKEEKTKFELGYVLISIGTALIFSLLPYWSNGGASIAGQPFVLYAFLNIKNRDLSYKNWLILVIFPFYSSLILAGMFVLVMLTIVALYDWYKVRIINIYLFASLLLMSILYLSIEYRSLSSMLNPLFVSHRVEFFSEYMSFYHSFHKSVRLFLTGQYHAHSIHGKVILPFVLLAGTIFLFRRFSGKSRPEDNYTFTLLLFSIVCISIFSGFEDFNLFQPIKEAYPILVEIQFDRFYFLYALLWFLLFAVSSKIVLENVKGGVLLILLFLSMQTVYSFSMQNTELNRDPKAFKGFYSTKMFSEIKDYINLPIDSYRIMNIGLYPSITLYNGFYTLDAYMVTYPIEYKHEFRKIISPQLAKSERWTKYYDNWGSRCRLMSREKNILLDLEQFKKMGGRFIFSSYDVNINNGRGVELLRKFSSNDSLYDVYLYSVN